jgi:predicted deacetylase
MDQLKWNRLEELFDTACIRPIVAVVPDNQDPELNRDPSDPFFWDTVHRWQKKGWAIAMHGYQHRFHLVDRHKLLLPFYDRSEFGGLSYAEQAKKIRLSWDLFKAQVVEPTVWIAPAHCFDKTTLDALRDETSIRIVSDGIALDQFSEQGFFWVPQQLWELAPRRYGLWTVCLHPSSMSQAAIDKLASQLSTAYFKNRVISMTDLILQPRSKGLTDCCYDFYFWNRGRVIDLLLQARDMIRKIV